MPSPQLENGHVRIANELYDAILAYDFTRSELCVIFSVIRYTYGFNRKSAKLSLKFIADGLGMEKRHICPVVNRLIRRRVLRQSSEATPRKARVIGLNKHYEEWEVARRNAQTGGVPKTGTVPEIGTVPKSVTLEFRKLELQGSENRNQEKTTLKTTLKTTGKKSLCEPGQPSESSRKSSSSVRAPARAKLVRKLGQIYTETLKSNTNGSGNLPLTPIRALRPGTERWRHCQARLFGGGRKPEEFLRDFEEAVDRACRTPFLLGDNERGWRADFDWFVGRADAVDRVLEGKYDDPRPAAPSRSQYQEEFRELD